MIKRLLSCSHKKYDLRSSTSCNAARVVIILSQAIKFVSRKNENYYQLYFCQCRIVHRFISISPLLETSININEIQLEFIM